MKSEEQRKLDRYVTYSEVLGDIAPYKPTDWLRLAQNASSFAKLRYEDELSLLTGDNARFGVELKIVKAQEINLGALLGLATKQEGSFDYLDPLCARMLDAMLAGRVMAPAMTFIWAENAKWLDVERRGLPPDEIITRDEAIKRMAAEVAEARMDSEADAQRIKEKTLDINPFYPTPETMTLVLRDHLHLPLAQTSIAIIDAAFASGPSVPSGPVSIPGANHSPAF